ncbi:hypothetical protein KR018_012331 [Drosophila ironensis]|nr:hypothetical protein KR018_012331 [Drosophila ironensis]
MASRLGSPEKPGKQANEEESPKQVPKKKKTDKTTAAKLFDADDKDAMPMQRLGDASKQDDIICLDMSNAESEEDPRVEEETPKVDAIEPQVEFLPVPETRNSRRHRPFVIYPWMFFQKRKLVFLFFLREYFDSWFLVKSGIFTILVLALGLIILFGILYSMSDSLHF